MRRNVLLVFAAKKCADFCGRVVRDGLREAGVEVERVTREASVCVCRGSHVGKLGALLRGAAEVKRGGGRRSKLSAARECDGLNAGRAVRPRAAARAGAMAIVAGKLDAAGAGAEEILLQMHGVVEFDGARIFEIVAQRSKFGMLGKREHRAHEVRSAGARREIRVALRARSVAHSDELRAPEMLSMARAARRSESLRGLVNGTVVAGEASLVSYRMAKGNGIRGVAGRALLPEKGMRRGDWTHAVSRAIAGHAHDGQPQERGHRKRHRKNETPAAKRMRPLEIGELDSLGQLLRCSWTTRQIRSPFFRSEAQGHDGMHRHERQQSVRQRHMDQEPSVQNTMQLLLTR